MLDSVVRFAAAAVLQQATDWRRQCVRVFASSFLLGPVWPGRVPASAALKSEEYGIKLCGATR